MLPMCRSTETAPLAPSNLSHGPPRLVDRLICVSVSTGVGVGDGDSPESPPRYFAGSLAALQPKRIEQRVVFVGVAVRPAVDCNRCDVARGIESPSAECSGQLLADLSLHGLERGIEQLDAAGSVLVSRR